MFHNIQGVWDMVGILTKGKYHSLRHVGYDQNLDQGKVLLIEVASLGWNPSKSLLMFVDNPTNKLYFLWPEPVCGIEI